MLFSIVILIDLFRDFHIAYNLLIVCSQRYTVYKTYLDSLIQFSREYVDKILLYGSQVWSCQYSGKSMLSFDDALKSEKKALKSLEKFPKCFKKVVFSTTHHCKYSEWLIC